MSIPRDIREFLENYPDNVDDPEASANFEFYSNVRRCRPDNRLIDEIHQQWTGDFDKLEYKHGYIQWLFPIQEYGMNYESQPLQRHEIRAMKADPAVVDRIITSYKMMLDFYGMRLISVDSGLLDRSLPPRNFACRYNHLARSSHNNLRISRILKCLSEFDLEHLSMGFLLHVLWEQSDGHGLDTPGIRSSMDRWWTNCLRDDEKRRRVGEFIQKVRSGENGYVFTRSMYREELESGATGSGIAPSTNVMDTEWGQQACHIERSAVTEVEEKSDATGPGP
ncbi:Opioid growth factor receptor-like protein 1 [Termitomyces sp. T112]|nr:Opioid growth factor receptor-like protein 1 [Termitomyces sp. T112]